MKLKRSCKYCGKPIEEKKNLFKNYHDKCFKWNLNTLREWSKKNDTKV